MSAKPETATSVTHAGSKSSADPLPIFDFFRAFAAWSVLAWHLAGALEYTGLPIFSTGAFAVDIFMVVSGFLMYYNYAFREPVEPWNKRRTWYTFWVRRFFRIAPLYYVLLIGTYLFRESLRLGPQFDLSALWLHLSFLFGFFPDGLASPFPDWSLALEMQFYLFFPLLAWMLRRLGPGPFFAAMAVTGAVTQVFVTYYQDSPPGLFGRLQQPSLLPLKIHIFTIGMIAADTYLRGRDALRSKWFILGFIALGFTCSYNYMRLMAVGYLLIYLVCLHPLSYRIFADAMTVFDRFCGKFKLLHWAAELSYSAYLLHALFFVIFFNQFPQVRSGGTMTAGEFICWYIATLIVVHLGAALTYLLIEKPGIRIGRSLAKLVRPR